MGEGNSFSLFTFRGGGVPGLRFSGRLIQPWTGGEGGGVPSLRFSGRLIQPWIGGGRGGSRSQ